MTIRSGAGRSILAAALITLSGLTGCFQMDYVITLDDDLSGEAMLDVAIDLDDMAYVIASIQRGFAGDEGSPTDEEIAAAREELLEQVESGALAEENMREEIEPDLPPGVTLLDASSSRDGLRTEVSIRLAFDHVSALDELDVGPDAGPGADTEPFGSIEIIDEGDTFVLRTRPMNPVEEAREEGAMLDGVPNLVETMFRNLRIGFTLDAPFEIVDHNATARDGSRLTWTYDYEALSNGEDSGIFVRYRR
ncbi:MAG: hypothetical protein ACC682_09760 [Gemmatimonadota bacterium]